MKRLLTCSIMLALLSPGASWAQEVLEQWQEEDDYELYFGDSDGPSEPAGPRDLHEALEQGRGYRIGGRGRHSNGAAREPERDVHTVSEGDTLWGIADRYYRDPWQWPRLWSYNPEITNPHWIYPSDQVRLSPGASAQDQALAANGEAPVSGGGVSSAHAVLPPKQMLTPGSVFLRDQGYLDQDALEAAGTVIGGNEEQMLLAHADEVYVKFAPGADIRAGQQYSVFRVIDQAERDPKESGKLVRIFGSVTIRSFDREKGVARGVLTESLDPIERGFSVAKVERRFDLVPPRRNKTNVVAHVIASVRPRSLLSYDNVVFLDVGRSKGIEPGNRFFVVRRGDPYIEAVAEDYRKFSGSIEVPEYDPSMLPKEVIAELRVVKVREETTIALVTRSDTDIAYGDLAEMRAGF